MMHERLVGAWRHVDARSLRVIATAAASYLGRFGTGLVVLVTLPMARQQLSAELFGVWMMLSALLGFLAFADLGIGNGVLNAITRAQAADDRLARRRILLAGYACTGAVGAGVVLSWLLWCVLATDPSVVVGRMAEAHRPEVVRALTTFVVLMALNIPLSLIVRVQLGLQEGYWNGVAQFCGAMLTLLAVPLALSRGAGVAGLVLATLGVQVAMALCNTVIWLARHALLDLSAWRGAWDRVTAATLLRSGGLFLLLQLSASFAFQSDAIVITHTLGQAAYGDFAVTQRLFLFVSMLINAALIGLWPAFGDALARQDRDWAHRALRRAALAALTLSLAVVLLLSAAMPWLMARWMPEAAVPSARLLAALSLWTVMDAVACVFAAFMNGANILRAQLLFAVGMALTAFGLKWLLTPSLGTTGAVVATIVAYALISVPGQFYIFKKTFALKD